MKYVARLVAALVMAMPLVTTGTLAPASAEEDARGGPPRAGEKASPKDLSALFEGLKAAPSPEAAKPLEEAIWRVWLHSGSDTVDLLMGWAVEAMAGKDLDLALRYLDTVVALKPDYAEGWNKRATVYFQQHDYTRSLADLQRVLALEPRHFAALSGLGLILQDIGDRKRALEAFRKALAINPNLDTARKAEQMLVPEVEGREL